MGQKTKYVIRHLLQSYKKGNQLKIGLHKRQNIKSRINTLDKLKQMKLEVWKRMNKFVGWK